MRFLTIMDKIGKNLYHFNFPVYMQANILYGIRLVSQSVKGNDVACKCCEISTFIKIMALTSFCD